MVQITISLSDDEVSRLDRIADAAGQSRASLVRFAVRRQLPLLERSVADEIHGGPDAA